MKSCILCVDITSLAGSKVSARSISPGGSVVALSDRLSLASGSLASGAAQDNILSPQQLGVMGNYIVVYMFFLLDIERNKETP